MVNALDLRDPCLLNGKPPMLQGQCCHCICIKLGMFVPKTLRGFMSMEPKTCSSVGHFVGCFVLAAQAFETLNLCPMVARGIFTDQQAPFARVHENERAAGVAR